MSHSFGKNTGVHYYPSHNFDTQSKLERRVSPGEKIALYVHIPFCETRCFFCTFSIVAGSKFTGDLVVQYMSALKAEMAYFGRILREQDVSVARIQIGGGTPTAISADQIKAMFDDIFELFDCSELEEIVFEGFPSSITREKIRALKSLGAVKLNVGAQTFDQTLLDEAGRRHDATEAIETFHMCKEEGIASLGIDLIYGLPGSSPAIVERDIGILAELPVDHLAFYPLWIYEKTTFDKQIRNGKFDVPKFEQLCEQLSVGSPLLAQAGFHRYTSFHYARGPQHHHGYGLWQMDTRDWLGLGMSSMSCLQGTVFFNEKNIEKYMKGINNGQYETGYGRRMDRDQQMRFCLLYGIRRKEYLTADFAARYGVQPQVYFADLLDHLAHLGFIEVTTTSISLTTEGIVSLGIVESIINNGLDELVAQ
ncbi:coproporphyrinogen-III oxidase family protein [Phaeobacter sp. B1627]|uniref:coproporphyrinogen-III oxidase family protein n=1 Tax=Phaeobacter sp. B1627 TaxID=2583809 RepID=UPI00111B46EF|nr:coproporphyrinogen-III oxidase family protein [Phaeobacter sp. B1627]TNJ42309.1 coproporphyrinogen III oxidase family protein [Phaeobacter sp. B1627]